jgi:NADH-quinone oxidoreductase subunit L
MSINELLLLLGVIVVAAPATLLGILGLTAMVGRPLGEVAVARWTSGLVSLGLASTLGILALMLITGGRYVPITFGNWVVLPEEHFHFRLKFVFDRLSIPFTILSFVLIGTIGAFANRYLHREAGYGRFFLLYALFLLGMSTASLAGTIETLFIGWELVGLSSALLVAYFHERSAPVRNGLRIWSVYRIADAAFLIAAVTMHHFTGAGDFAGLLQDGPWPEGEAALSSSQALSAGLLLLVAVAGKSALIPFCGWLPRAMEGPTPSSAVFYGALSVHLGVYLLLRVSPILDTSICLSVIVVVLGLGTALLAALTARVQTDVKSAIAYASLTQVGLITAEIGFGLRYLALIHIIGHACLRTLQLLRAPTLLRDYHLLRNAIGGDLPHASPLFIERVPDRIRLALYRLSLERWYFDAILDQFVVRPFLGVFRWCDQRERQWTHLLTHGSDKMAPNSTSLRDMRDGNGYGTSKCMEANHGNCASTTRPTGRETTEIFVSAEERK